VIFRPAPLAGVFLVEPERREDERGFFARTFCREEFAAHGLEPAVAQCSLSFTRTAGTVRGMHYQAATRREAKLVRCTRGAIFDAVVDLRAGSPTLGRPFTVELTADSRLALYIPPDFAHGFQTLAPATEVAYQMSEAYEPGSDRGFRWDDPAVGIAWPLPVAVISARDRGLPSFAEREGARQGEREGEAR
jgi:dTDP-4-dehydrorhamnose 3,5-epimerase